MLNNKNCWHIVQFLIDSNMLVARKKVISVAKKKKKVNFVYIQKRQYCKTVVSPIEKNITMEYSVNTWNKGQSEYKRKQKKTKTKNNT